MKKTVSLLVLCLFLASSAFAQVGTSQDQTTYERKSISYVNALWLASPTARTVDNQKVTFMLDNVKKWIEMDRFDFNPLPDKLTTEFVTAANAQETITVEGLAQLMEEKLVPEISKILAFEMEMRGQSLVGEAARQGFLAQKAKETGITLEQIEKVMNSAYIYLPVLTGYVNKANDKGTYTCIISGGIIWFHIDNSGNAPVVKLKVANNTESMGFGSEKCAYQSAVNNFSRNLQTATRDIPEFKLGAPIAEADGNNITIALGKKEGLRIDDTYLTGEWVMDAEGNTKFENNGWVKIGKVADNREDPVAKSEAWGVKNPGFVAGLQTVEYPRLGIDVGIKPGVFATKVDTGFIPVFGGWLEVTEEYDGMAPGLDLDFQINLGIRQTFLLLGGHASFPAGLEFKDRTGLFSNVTTTAPFIWGVHGGFMKKIYMGRMAIGIEAKGGVKFFTVAQSFNYLSSDYTLTINNNTIGGQAGLSFEYAATPAFNIGIFGAYKFYSVSDVWDVTVEGGTPLVFSNTSDFPKVDHSGIAIGLYMHWTPGSLPFDPVDLFKGMVAGNDYCD